MEVLTGISDYCEDCRYLITDKASIVRYKLDDIGEALLSLDFSVLDLGPATGFLMVGFFGGDLVLKPLHLSLNV